MLHIEDDTIKKLLLKGKFGFELESHRITMDGHLAHTAHPFPGDPHISRDFSEDQIEINTSPYDTAEEAIDAMEGYMAQVQEALCRKDRQECRRGQNCGSRVLHQFLLFYIHYNPFRPAMIFH